MLYKKPLPHPNADDRVFWEGCRAHELRFQKCNSCGLIRWPSSIICPECYSDSAEWIKASGRGSVYTYAVFHQAYHPGFENELPYITAVIALEEGPHFMSNIVDCKPEDIGCDMPVEVVWDDITEEYTLPKFSPQK